ncbi:MAG: glycosyltransferase [Coriobacteriia bacterium]|nr:glycosyltransferase [Coriobacteriia bacterium]
MRLTVITACLNAAPVIGDAIESVLAQGDALHEYIVVDGGSTDGTVALLDAASERFGGRLSHTSQPDDGIYDALNVGVARATGTHVLVLGADDRLLDGSLAALAAAPGADGADLVYGDAVVVEPDGRTRPQPALLAPRLVGGIPRELPVCHQACAFSKAAFDRLGPFDETYRVAADYEFYLRFFEAGLRAVHIAQPLVAYSLGGSSSRQLAVTADEYRRARILHGVAPLVARLAWARSVVAASLMRGVRSIR